MATRKKKKKAPDVEAIAERIEEHGHDVTQATIRREVFAQHYLSSLSAAAAVEDAGLTPYTTEQAASSMRNHPIVKQRILELMDERAVRTGITADKVLLELAHIAFANIKDFFEWDGTSLVVKDDKEIDDVTASAIKKIWTDDNGRTRVELYDKLSALNTIARHLGMFTTRVEINARVTGKIDVANGLSNLETAELLQLRTLAEKMALPARSEVVDGDATDKKKS